MDISHIEGLRPMVNTSSSKENLLDEVKRLRRQVAMLKSRQEKKTREEKSLRESEQTYRTLFEESPNGVLLVRNDGCIVSANSRVKQLFGYGDDEMLNQFTEMLIPHSQRAIHTEHRKYFNSNPHARPMGRGINIYGLRKDGSEFPVDISLSPISVGSKKLTMAIIVDITERVQWKEDLERSHSMLEATIESTADGLLVVDINGKITRYNRKFAELWRIPKDILDTKEDRLALEFVSSQLKAPESFLKKVEELYATPEAESIDILYFKDGRIFERYSQPQRLGEKIVGRVWSFRDVTERIQTEAALKKSEAELKTIFDILPVGLSILDSQRNILDINPALENITRISKSDLFKGIYKHRTYIRADGSTIDTHELPSTKSLREQRVIKDEEMGIVLETGDIIWTSISAAPIPIEGLGVVVITSDITERKRAIEALIESDRRFRALVENTSDGIELVDAAGNILYATPSSGRMLGYAPEEFIGKNIFDLVHEDDRDYSMKKMAQILSAPGQRVTAEARVQHKNKSWLWVEGIGTNLLDEPSIRAIVINFRDITEQKRAEETIRLQATRAQALANISQTHSHRLLEVQENERRMLARELHDEIGQILTAVKIDLEVLRQNQLPDNLQVRLNDDIGTLDKCLQQIRNLSLDLRPSILDDLGLLAALQWQLNRQTERAGFKSRFFADEFPSRLHTDIETACFRVAQESLTNISRHAKAKNVELHLWVEKDDFTLSINDDGIGFDIDNAFTHTTHGATLGLLGMQERVKLLGGSLSITSKKGEGTTVQIQLPMRFKEKLNRR